MTQSAAISIDAGQLAPGTELIVDRRGYKHHGIYIGDGLVIHYAGWISYPRGLVEEIAVADFVAKRPFRTGRHPDDPAHGAEIVRRARSRLGERSYNLLQNNCEHLCNWCQIGESTSAQVEMVKRRVQRAVRVVRVWRSRPIEMNLQQRHPQPGR
jgi:hypothetical protein